MKTVKLSLFTAAAILSASTPARAQTFTWTNAIAGTKAWSAAANWSPNAAPASGGNSAYVLNFNAPGANNTANNDLPGKFVLNGIKFSAGNVTLTGGQLGFAANGAVGPSLTNSLPAPPTINNDIALDANLTLNGVSGYILGGVLSGSGGFTNNVSGGGWTTLYGANTYSGVTVMAASSGTLKLVGDSPLGATSQLIQNGGGLVLWGTTVNVPVTVNGGHLLWSAPGATSTVNGLITLASGVTWNVDSLGSTSAGSELHLAGGVRSAGGHLEIFDDYSGSDTGRAWIDTTPINLGSGELRGFGVHINVPGNVVGTIHPYYGRRITLEVNDAFSGAPALLLGGNADGGGSSVGRLDLKGYNLLVSSLTDNGDTGNEVTGTNGTLTVSNIISTTYVGLLSGPGLGLVKDGPGTLTLGANNTYSGNTVVQGGTLYLKPGAAPGAYNQVKIMAGATLGGAGTVSGDAFVYDGGSLLADWGLGAQSLQFSSTLSLGLSATDRTTNNFDLFHGGQIQAVGLSLAGTNVINILAVPQGTNTLPLITYGWSSTNGVFQLGALPPGITAHLEDSDYAIRLVITASSVESDVWIGNVNSNWDLSGALNWKGSITGRARGYTNLDTVLFNDAASNFWVNLSTIVTPTAVTVSNAAQAYTFYGPGGIGGAASLTKTGPGWFRLGTANTNTGLTTIDDGTLQLGMINALPPTANVLVNGGALDLNNISQTINTLNGAGGLLTNSGPGVPILTVGNGDGSSAFSGLIAGPVGLAKLGAGTATIAGTNTYTGPTTVSVGTLLVSDLAPLGRSTNVTIAGGLLVLSNAMVGAPITASAPYGSHLKWTGPGASNVISGRIIITNTPLLNINSLADTSPGSELHITGGIISSGSHLEIFDDYSGSLDSGNVWIETTPINLGTGELRGFGLHINVASNIVGAIHPYYGRRISLGGNDAFSGAPGLIMGDPSWGQLDLNGHRLLVGSLTDNGDSVNIVTSEEAAVLTVSNSAPNTYGGRLAGSGLALVKAGAGTLTLNGNATYGGSTTVDGGTLAVQGTLGSGANTVTVTNGSLAGTGTIWDAVAVQPGGALSPAGAGIDTLTISNSLTLAGTTAVDISKNDTAITNDLVQGVTNLTYGGTLAVSLSGTTALAVNDSIKLFDALNYSGAFTSISPAPGSGLAWDTSSLTVDGTLKVKAALVNTMRTNLTWSVTGMSLTLSWPQDHTGWRLLAQTNHLEGLSTNPLDWGTVANSDQTNCVSITIDPAKAAGFYRLVYP